MLDLVRQFLISVEKCPHEKQQALRKRGHLKPEQHLYSSVHKQSKNYITTFQKYRHSKSKKKCAKFLPYYVFNFDKTGQNNNRIYDSFLESHSSSLYSDPIYLKFYVRSQPSAGMFSDLWPERNLSLYTHTDHMYPHTPITDLLVTYESVVE